MIPLMSQAEIVYTEACHRGHLALSSETQMETRPEWVGEHVEEAWSPVCRRW